jgi:hypothetical protein
LGVNWDGQKKRKSKILHVTKISHLIFPCRSLIHTGGIDLFFGLIGDGQKKRKSKILHVTKILDFIFLT